MSWEDTVTPTNEENCHNTLEERLNEQAKKSYEAGVKEVVELLGKVSVNKFGFVQTSCDYIKWVSQLKEWGL